MSDATLPAGPAPTETHAVDCCVVGGGMSGVCAAIAAARRGLRVAIVQDRAVFGGNASSEVRMWICGARGADNKETGIIEELQLRNIHRNPYMGYPMWDAVLFEAVTTEPGITAFLSCAVTDVEMAAPDRIGAVRAWHLTRQCWVRIEAAVFIDCSGDSVLRLSGAQTRWGREARHEFGESYASETASRMTMGNSILLQLRAIDPADHIPYRRPAWVPEYPLDHERLSVRGKVADNFWWIEFGGEGDTIGGSDTTRDELYRIALGSWAWIKNHPDGRGKGWELEWIGALPGKRENIRYVGDHTMTQQDVEAEGRFDDLVCHGGWPMDDHPSKAFHNPGPATVFFGAPSPFGIPWRSLYSATIANLLCAGRNISTTHMALSATRVMATCATMGQAVGTAAAICVQERITPREVGRRRLRTLQRRLLDDDQFLPGRRRPVPALTMQAAITASSGDAEPLRDGIDRRLGEAGHRWEGAPGDWAAYRFAAPAAPGRVRIVCDTELHRPRVLPCSVPLRRSARGPFPGMARAFRIEGLSADGAWTPLHRVDDNDRRLHILPIPGTWHGVRLVLESTWGDPVAGFFAFDAGTPEDDGEIPEAPWVSLAPSKTHAA